MTNIVDALTKAEISFAQQLASGEPAVRTKAIIKLRRWFKSTIMQNDLKTDNYMRLWKGLYYCMWMQDKPLLQEDLADNICKFLEQCNTIDKVIKYQETFYQTIANEWPTIDQWRIDKFMMMVRRMLRHTLAYVRNKHEWSKESINKLTQSWRRTVLSTDPNWCLGLKMHFNSIILDEIDNANTADKPLTLEEVTELLLPFIELLSERQTSDRHFMSICSDVLETILIAAQQESEDLDEHPKMKRLQAIEQDESDESGDESASASATSSAPTQEQSEIKFNYQDIAKRLFDVGSKKDLPSQRRKKLYTLVKRFEAAATGSDPFEDDEDENVDAFAGDKDSIDMAARRLLRREDAARQASQTLAEIEGRKEATTPEGRKRQKNIKIHKSTDEGDSSDNIVEMSEDELVNQESDGEPNTKMSIKLEKNNNNNKKRKKKFKKTKAKGTKAKMTLIKKGKITKNKAKAKSKAK